MHSSFLHGSPGIDLWVVRKVSKLERRKKKKKKKKKKKRKNNDSLSGLVFMNIHYNKPIDCSVADRQTQNSRMLLKAVLNAFPRTKISNIFDGACHQTSTKHRSEYTTGISSPSRQEQTVNSL